LFKMSSVQVASTKLSGALWFRLGRISAVTERIRGNAGNERLAALLIGAAALLEVVLITHHPIVRTGHGDVPFAGIKAVMDANLAFHSVLMMVLVGQLVGLVLFARALGLERAIVLTGLVLCALASLMLSVAMTFDGFVTHELMSSCTPAAHGCAVTTADSFRVVLATISAFSKVGFGAQCLGFAALSAAMWAPGERVRLAAIAGGAFAIAPIALIALGGRVDPGRLLEILAFLAAWGFCVATALASGIIGSRASTSRAPYPRDWDHGSHTAQ
jgi:hypothetical protein